MKRSADHDMRPRSPGEDALVDRVGVFRASVAEINKLQWRHLISVRTDEAEPLSAPMAGYTTWIATLTDGDIAALSWAWVVIDPGVITVENMLQIASNLYPTEDDGSVLGPDRRTQVLARILSGLEWYDLVRETAIESRMG